jgi:uncharacterized SAM-binding protein YcdF (DUF218 family)
VELARNAVKDLIPGSLLFLVLGSSLGVLLLFGPSALARRGRLWLLILTVVYVLLSLQGTSDLLVRGLRGRARALPSADAADGARVVVVLSNGTQTFRTSEGTMEVVNAQSGYNVLEGARLYRLLGDPLVLVSGGRTDPSASRPECEVLSDALQTLGVPATRIECEDHSTTTYQQAVRIRAWIGAHDNAPFVLVTAPEHLHRALATLKKFGTCPIASPSALQYGGAPFWRPTRFALEGSRSAIYEYLACAFYTWKGWM